MTKTEEERIRNIEDVLLLLPRDIGDIKESSKATEQHLEMINGSLGNLDDRVEDVETRHEYIDKQNAEKKDEKKERKKQTWMWAGFIVSIIAVSEAIAALLYSVL